jgi:serine/threonine protein kinase
MEQDSFSSSSSSSSSDEDDVVMQEDETPPPEPFSTTNNSHERAYWMQRTVREAIYGRVLYAIVLKRNSNTCTTNNEEEAEWQVTSEKCAVKEMSWNHIRQDRNRLAEDPIKEVSAMQYLQKWYHLQHHSNDATTDGHRTTTRQEQESLFGPIMETNIMMPLDLLSDDRHLYSIMPFCDGGELFDRLDINERFSEEEARFWMHQVLNGLEHLQQSGICHRDMSLENLLVHQNGALIIDMGMCLRIPYPSQSNTTSIQEVDDSFTNINLDAAEIMINGNDVVRDDVIFPWNGKTTPRQLITPQGTCGKWIYMSPEIYKNDEPFDGFAVDMWAAGVILFLMLTGFPPWERACMTDDRFKYMTAGYLVQMLTEWEVGLSSDAMDLLQRMLFLDPRDRLSLDQVKAHPWMMAMRTP